MKNDRFYRIKLFTIPLANGDKLPVVKEFKKNDLRHSKAYAEEEFSEAVRSIKSENSTAENTSNILKPDVQLFLVENKEGIEYEYFLRSIDKADQANIGKEKSVLQREKLETQRMAENGFLRHSILIGDLVFFHFQELEIVEGIENELLSVEESLTGYTSFDDALKEYRDPELIYLFYDRTRQPDPNNEVTKRSYMIIRNEGETQEFPLELSPDNPTKNGLPEALQYELADKYHFERIASAKKGRSVQCGFVPILWDRPYQKPTENSPQLSWKDYEELARSAAVLDSIEITYVVYLGTNNYNSDQRRVFINHDLLQARDAAIEFYERASKIFAKVTLVYFQRLSPFLEHCIRSTIPSKGFKAGRRNEKTLLESLGYSLSDDDA